MLFPEWHIWEQYVTLLKTNFFLEGWGLTWRMGDKHLSLLQHASARAQKNGNQIKQMTILTKDYLYLVKNLLKLEGVRVPLKEPQKSQTKSLSSLSSKVVEEQSRALALDALRSSHPVEVAIRHGKEVGSACPGDRLVGSLVRSFGTTGR